MLLSGKIGFICCFVKSRKIDGKTIVMITHNSALAQAADRVIRLRSGQVIEVKTNAQPVPPEEIVW